MDMRMTLGYIIDNRGHKNYCYQRHLAEKSPFDSFRFDFRGNGDSGRSIHAPRTLKVYPSWLADDRMIWMTWITFSIICDNNIRIVFGLWWVIRGVNLFLGWLI